MFNRSSVGLQNLAVLLTGVSVFGVLLAAASPQNSTVRAETTATPNPTAVPTPVAGSIAFAEPSFSVKENAGSATISVRRVVRDGVGASGAVSVHYQTKTGGSATVGSDYTTVTGTLSWADGDDDVKTFTVPIINDTAHEPTETVYLRLYDITGTGTIAPSRQNAVLSILDDDAEVTRTPEPTRTPEATRKPEPTRTPEATRTPEPTRKPEPTRTPEATRTPEPTRKPEPTKTPAPTPAAGSIAFAEPKFSVKENAGAATISVRRVVRNGVGVSGAVSVKYQTTTGGTATASSDYKAVTGTLSWADGDDDVKTFRVPIIDDKVREATETVSLRLYDLVGSGTIAPTRKTATLSILDNETGSIDKTKPTVTIVVPAANAHVSNLNTISGTAKDEGGSRLKSVGLLIQRLSDHKYWSGTEWVTREVLLTTKLSGNSWSRSEGNPGSSDLSDDFYRLTAIAVDGAGNSGRASVEVSINSSPPSVTIFSPLDGAKLRSLARVAGTVSDESGTATVVVFLRRSSDGKYWNGHEWARSTPLAVQQDDSGEWSRTEWPTLEAGNYTLTATATNSLKTSSSVTNEFSIASSARSAGRSAGDS